MESKYIQILKKLAENELEEKQDLTLFLRNLFKREVDAVDINYDLIGSEIHDFLLKMQRNQHITYIDSKQRSSSYEISITVTGLSYLDSYTLIRSNTALNESNERLNISNALINESTLKNYRTQRRLAYVTLVLAGIGAGFSTAEFFKGEPKMEQLNKNIQVLSKETEGIKLEVHKLRSLPASDTVKYRKP